MNPRKEYIENHKDRFLSELFTLLKKPSISADSTHYQDVIETAELVKESLKAAGCELVEICETPGYPVVYGEKNISPELPTISGLWTL